MAALEKYNRLCGLAIHLFSYISGGWKSEIKVPADLVSAKDPLSGLQMAVLLYPYMT